MGVQDFRTAVRLRFFLHARFHSNFCTNGVIRSDASEVELVLDAARHELRLVLDGGTQVPLFDSLPEKCQLGVALIHGGDAARVELLPSAGAARDVRWCDLIPAGEVTSDGEVSEGVFSIALTILDDALAHVVEPETTRLFGFGWM